MTAITDDRLALATAAYLDAALNKLEVAAYHQARLADRLRSGEATRVEVQAYFEGLLYAGVAATDQVAEVLNQAFVLSLTNANLRRALEALQGRQLQPDAERTLEQLSRWRRRRAVREAGTVRWRATHHYYPKGLREGAWQYEASDGIGVEEGGGVGQLAEEFVADLSDFGPLIEQLAAIFGVDERLQELRRHE